MLKDKKIKPLIHITFSVIIALGVIMPAIRQDSILLRLIKDVNDIRSALRRVTVNLPLFDIANENTPVQITVDQNNYVPGNYDILRLASDQAGRTITGFSGGIKGRSLRLFNVGSYEIILAHQNAASDAANRIISPTGFDMVLNAGGEIVFYYDSTQQRWRSSYNSNADRISAELQLSADQSIANAAYDYIDWNVVVTDTGGFYDPLFPWRVVIPETGWYFTSTIIQWEVNGTNLRETDLVDQTAGVSLSMDSRLAVTGALTRITLNSLQYFTKGTAIGIEVWQNSGGPLKVISATSHTTTTSFKIVKA